MTKAWDQNKATILAYYETQRKPLLEVIQMMKKYHSFEAS